MSYIGESEYPGLFKAADRVAKRSKYRHHLCVALYLAILVLAVATSLIDQNSADWDLGGVYAVLFALSTALTVYTRVSNYNELWYNGRAVAESVKTMAWRFAMKAAPYDVSDDEARTRFILNLREVLRQNKSLLSKVSTAISEADPISNKLSVTRNMPLQDREALCRADRITDQELYYKDESDKNRKCYNIMNSVIMIVNSLCLLFALLVVLCSVSTSLIDMGAIVASVFMTWLQTKKYEELSVSYALTLHEIVLIKNQVQSIGIESDFSRFVIECENAFSREHTQWYAQRQS